ncbi:MAG: dUTP pyrophosphatase [Clostridia bacterium]|nr:dUTP pyrophosphatase [Clostridia bacterium]
MNTITDNTLYWAKTNENAIIPTKSEENAGYDIYANFEEDYLIINPCETKLIPTGVACAVSDEYYLQVQERGSTGSKGMKYGAGVIDSGYRGEIFIAITNTNEIPVCIVKENIEYNRIKLDTYPYTNVILYPISKGIAQLVVHNVPKMKPVIIDYEELKKIPSDRQEGNLGSSGK